MVVLLIRGVFIAICSKNGGIQLLRDFWMAGMLVGLMMTVVIRQFREGFLAIYSRKGAIKLILGVNSRQFSQSEKYEFIER